MQQILSYLSGKVKSAVRMLNDRDIYLSVVIILVAFASFGLGRLSKITETKGPVSIESKQKSAQLTGTETGVAAAVQAAETTRLPYVASKNGTKYYLADCAGAKRISQENRIWFSSKEEALAAGYGPAANCPGM